MTAAVLSYNSKVLWYLTRGFGLVALVLLTASMVLGLAEAVRFNRPGLPRFVVAGLHRNVSLLAVVILAIHVTTAVIDSYAPISAFDAFVPFVSKYRPIWTGLGALAADLLVALVVTSLIRERLGYRMWRAIHWTAYACWPVAVVHGLGTGSDTKVSWVLALNAVCVAAVLVALWWRLAQGWGPANVGVRGSALAASLVVPVVVVAWTVVGPLRPGWARGAGTPADLLGGRSVPSTGALSLPFGASFSGTESESGVDGDGAVTVTISGSFRGDQDGVVQVVLEGQPLASGGVNLTSSQVDIGPVTTPSLYHGHATDLRGTVLTASLVDPSGSALDLTLRLNAITGGDQVTGSVVATS